MTRPRLASLDLIVPDLDAASDFVEQVAPFTGRERVPGFSCYSFGDVDVMLSESALLDVGVSSGVILHVEVEDVDALVASVAERHGLTPSFGPATTDWGTRSAIFRSPDMGFAIDLHAPA